MITTKIDFKGSTSMSFRPLLKIDISVIDNNDVELDMHNIPCNEMIVRCQTPNNL